MVRKSPFIPGILAINFILSGCGPNNPPGAPVVTVSDTLVEGESLVQLEATAYDPDNDILTWSWQATGGSFSSTTMPITTWTAPTVTDTQQFTLTVRVTDPGGLSASTDTTVTTYPRTSGELKEVIIGQMEQPYDQPFWVSPGDTAAYMRVQVLYHGSEIGFSGRVRKISLMPATVVTSAYFNNFNIYLASVSRDELDAGFDENYEGSTPQSVFYEFSLDYAAPVDTWRDFTLTSAFDYDTTNNLLVEFEWKEYTGSGVQSYGYETVLKRCNWTDAENSIDGLTENHALYTRLVLEVETVE